MINRISVLRADITTLKVDAIVNAANNTLLGGGGVDGAIHLAAGPGLLEECRELKGCATGQSKLTGAYNLPSKFVIHTVGPVWYGGDNNEEYMLKSCYNTALKLATENSVNTIAFPAISTGVYRYPIEQATKIAIRTTLEYLNSNNLPQSVIFVCFSENTEDIYKDLINQELHNF